MESMSSKKPIDQPTSDNTTLCSINSYEDGTCRTLKSQYFKNSTDNFDSHGTFGATGVLAIQKETVHLKKPIDLSVNDPNETVISNAITARQDRGISNQKSIGGVSLNTVHMNNNTIVRQTNIASALLARDYKGFGNYQNGNGIIETE